MSSLPDRVSGSVQFKFKFQIQFRLSFGFYFNNYIIFSRPRQAPDGDAGIRREIRRMRRENGRRRKTFFRESFPAPFQRTCWKIMGAMLCLAAFCLRQNFGVFLRKLLKILQAAFFRSFLKNPPEFHLCEAKFCTRQGRKPFDLKVALVYRSFALEKSLLPS